MQNKQPSSEAFPVADSAPYPPLKVTGPNIQAACRLSQALAGAKSEMTAIMSYEYQHWILASCRPELAVTVFRIAKVEMHHLDMLGQLIVLLGADPRFGCDQRGSCAWWSGSMVCY
ncbi:MAG: rubrerythrin family protein, partial [Oscillospiraceae bacterium]|nr:rubrerythrin family protein [Oscillospiraceae bacterium]